MAKRSAIPFNKSKRDFKKKTGIHPINGMVFRGGIRL